MEMQSSTLSVFSCLFHISERTSELILSVTISTTGTETEVTVIRPTTTTGTSVLRVLRMDGWMDRRLSNDARGILMCALA